MQIIIIGGGGFLGQKFVSVLLNLLLVFNELFFVDLKMFVWLLDFFCLCCLEVDLIQLGVLESVIIVNIFVVYYFVVIVSSYVEDDFDLGWKVNLDFICQLFEVCC